jgi:hypothetical protein
MARTTLVEALGRLILKWRLNTRVRPSIPQPRRPSMDLSIFNGYKTYVVAMAMLIAGLAQLLGVDLPTFDGQSAGHLLMEGLAILFLRQGMKG